MGNRGSRVRNYLAAPVDAASLALFRICFGLVMVYEVMLALWPAPHGSWVQLILSAPRWHFSYPGFGWVHPWPEPLLTVHFLLLGLAGLLVALGLFYRLAAVAMTLLWTYVFLLDEALYLNHGYLMCLLSFLLIVVPADSCFALDRWRRPSSSASGASTIPFWPVFLLRSQLFIVYFYGGLAKLNGDWLSGHVTYPAGVTLRKLLASVLPDALIPLLDPSHLARFLALTGVAFDLSICFLLLWRRGRLLALVLLAIFHSVNSQTFNIGVFPMLGFTGTLIFCEPDWPRRLAAWLRVPVIRRPDFAWVISGALALPLVGALLGWNLPRGRESRLAGPFALRGALLAFLGLWLAVQLLLPLRHWLIAGNTEWTEEQGRFSWRMMSHSKEGVVQFTLVDPGLCTTDESGRTRIDWARWTRWYPRVVYTPVDAAHLDRQRLPRCLVVYEPLIGERIVWNAPLNRTELDQARRTLEEQWLAEYGRGPTIVATRSVRETVEALGQELAERKGTLLASPAKQDFRSDLGKARQIAASLSGVPGNGESLVAKLHELLAQLLLDADFGTVVGRHLACTHPLSLQGARVETTSWFVIEDSQLDRWDGGNRRMIDRARWKGTDRVHLDLSRMNHSSWARLPDALAIEVNGAQHLVWNQHAELELHQVEKLGEYPGMIYQYAQHIAELWQGRFGRRPEVHVAGSQVVLNGRPPQPLIDPRVDLAAASLRFFRHNDWILPLCEERAGKRIMPVCDQLDHSSEPALRRVNYQDE